MYDFFISFAGPERRLAEIVHSVLVEGGCSCFYQGDFAKGSNFVQRINEGLEESRALLALYSPSYFESKWAQAELSAAFADDPGNYRESIVPLLVADSKIPPLFATINYVDCRGLTEDQLAALVREEVLTSSRTSAAQPEDPRIPETNTPGVAQKLLDDLDMAFAIFKAQSRIRNQLFAAMHERDPSLPFLEYEAFFARYYEDMTADERRLHARLRDHTRTLEKLNRRALYYVEANSEFAKHAPDLPTLRSHLRAWLEKYEIRFDSDPSVGVVYVGVDEGRPFPSNVTSQIADYIAAST